MEHITSLLDDWLNEVLLAQFGNPSYYKQQGQQAAVEIAISVYTLM